MLYARLISIRDSRRGVHSYAGWYSTEVYDLVASPDYGYPSAAVVRVSYPQGMWANRQPAVHVERIRQPLLFRLDDYRPLAEVFPDDSDARADLRCAVETAAFEALTECCRLERARRLERGR